VTFCNKLFQTPATATVKVQSSTVDSRVPVRRRTISDGDEVERRRRRASKSALWITLSLRYDGYSVPTLTVKNKLLSTLPQ